MTTKIQPSSKLKVTELSATEQKPEGILLVDKPTGWTSFSIVSRLRRLTGVKKIGHAGTLDPFATGVMVMLVGKKYTRLSDTFLNLSKEYTTRVHLGIATDSFDCDGVVLSKSEIVPTLSEVEQSVALFQGEVEQTVPIFSAKKVGGRKLYDIARKGETIELPKQLVTIETELLSYSYPFIDLRISCSKGTYIRSVASDLGKMLKCGAHLSQLRRTRSGEYKIGECLDGMRLEASSLDITPFLVTLNEDS
jgi:tRNA pseudouridine55 synthase